MNGTISSTDERLNRLEAEVERLRDREAIRDVIYRYCRAVDRADLDLLKSCYWPDGFDDHGFYSGNAMEFCEFVAPLLRKTTATTHSISNPIIEVDASSALAESQVDVLHRLLDDGGQMIYEWAQCRYLDRFEKRTGEWRIRTRTVAVDGMFWMKMDSALMLDRGMLQDNLLPAGARHPDDPVYRLKDVESLVKPRIPVSDFWSGLAAVGRKL